jgi:hypothetical protein
MRMLITPIMPKATESPSAASGSTEPNERAWNSVSAARLSATKGDQFSATIGPGVLQTMLNCPSTCTSLSITGLER